MNMHAASNPVVILDLLEANTIERFFLVLLIYWYIRRLSKNLYAPRGI